MKSLHIRLWIVAALVAASFWLVACSSLEVSPTAALTRAATATRTSTLRPTGSATASPTATTTPSNTPTPRPTQTPRDTPTPLFKPLTGKPPAPQITPAFPTSTLYPLIPLEPSPIAPPQASAYRLKAWNEAEALAMVRRMNEYSYEVDMPSPGDFRVNFSNAQNVVNTAAREMLLRYPDAADREQVQWMVAFSDVLNSQTSDEWLAAEIERHLNLGWLDPAKLGDGLIPFGFDAQIAQVVEYRETFQATLNPFVNLFGDGRPGYIWKVFSIEEYYLGGELHLALEQLEDGSFRVARITSHHNFPLKVGTVLDVLDLTGDGQPEAIITVYDCEFGCNALEVGVFQWKGNRFVDVSHGNFGRQPTWGGDITWEYGKRDEYGAVEITVKLEKSHQLNEFRLLRWNGSWFEIVERWVALPASPPQIMGDPWQFWLDYALESLEFEGAEELYQHLITNPLDKMGPAYPDYIRFHRAMAAAYTSRSVEARKLLQEIIDSPLYLNSSLVSTMAAAFLKDYTDDTSLLRSCQAAWEVLDRISRPLRGISPHTSEAGQIKDGLAVGYLNPPCSLRSAFRLLLSSLMLSIDTDVTSVLRQAGVPVLRSIRDDFDGDGSDDWLVVIDTAGAGPSTEAWVFVAEGSRYLAVPVYDFDRLASGLEFDRFSLIGDIERSNLPVRIEYCYFPENVIPAIILQTGDTLRIFEVLHEGNYAETNLMLELTDVANFSSAPSGYELIIEFTPGSRRNTTVNYRYNEYLQGFQSIDPVEALIFEQGDMQGAIELIPTLWVPLDLSDYWYGFEEGRLGYFLGLAHELSGNPDAAVEAYLGVWRDFPASPYALMAQMKLEPVE